MGNAGPNRRQHTTSAEHGGTVRLAGAATRGRLVAGSLSLPCVIGRSGRAACKREGDGATPIGRFRLLEVLYRADRLPRPQTPLPVRALRRHDGWCDAPGDRNYNRPVRHPYLSSAEHLWRDDHLYDLVVVLDCNIRPRVQGRGSAIFMHLSRADGTPTAGCIALGPRDLRLFLARAQPGATVCVPA